MSTVPVTSAISLFRHPQANNPIVPAVRVKRCSMTDELGEGSSDIPSRKNYIILQKKEIWGYTRISKFSACSSTMVVGSLASRYHYSGKACSISHLFLSNSQELGDWLSRHTITAFDASCSRAKVLWHMAPLDSLCHASFSLNISNLFDKIST